MFNEAGLSSLTGAPIDALAADRPGLSAATCLYLTSGKAAWLKGRCAQDLTQMNNFLFSQLFRRFVNSTWDLGEVERDWKEKILATNGLVSKLSIPE